MQTYAWHHVIVGETVQCLDNNAELCRNNRLSDNDKKFKFSHWHIHAAKKLLKVIGWYSRKVTNLEQRLTLEC